MGWFTRTRALPAAPASPPDAASRQRDLTPAVRWRRDLDPGRRHSRYPRVRALFTSLNQERRLASGSFVRSLPRRHKRTKKALCGEMKVLYSVLVLRSGLFTTARRTRRNTRLFWLKTFVPVVIRRRVVIDRKRIRSSRAGPHSGVDPGNHARGVEPASRRRAGVTTLVAGLSFQRITIGSWAAPWCRAFTSGATCRSARAKPARPPEPGGLSP
jgi:hypothetical protein